MTARAEGEKSMTKPETESERQARENYEREWTHVICPACARSRRPRWQEPEAKGVERRCCFCGGPTTVGLGVHYDPAALRCGGQHGAP